MVEKVGSAMRLPGWEEARMRIGMSWVAVFITTLAWEGRRVMGTWM